jgi:hypothetical protein
MSQVATAIKHDPKPEAAHAAPPAHTAPPAAALAPLPQRPLRPSDYRSAEYTTRRSTITLAQEEFRRVSDPVFWSNIIDSMRPGDFIEVHSPDSSYFAELYVRKVYKAGDASSKPGAVVQVLRHLKFEPIETAEIHANAPAYKAMWLGPNHNWGVIRIADGVTVVADLPDEDAARGHLRAMTRTPTK